MALKFAIPFLILLIVVGCRKEPISWDSEYTLPIAHSRLTVEDLVGDTSISTNPDQSIQLNLKRTIFELDVDSVLQIPDTSVTQSYSVIDGITLTIQPGAAPFISQPEEDTYEFGGAELREFSLRNGFLHYIIKSYIDAPTENTLKIPSASIGGQPFETIILIPESDGITPVEVDGVIDLTGYKFDLTGTAGDKYNTIATLVESRVDPNASGPATISSADSIVAEFQFSEITPQFALGYFGNELIAVNDTTSIPGLSNVQAGSINLNDLYLDLEIENGVGIDLQAQINSLNGQRLPNTVVLTHSIIGSVLNVNRGIHVGGVSTASTYPISFTPGNSNLESFIELLPNTIGYDLSLQLNPFGNASSHNDFYNYDSPLKVNMELNMPLCLSADNILFQDTLEVSVDLDSTNVQEAELILELDNNFPFNAALNLGYLKPNGTGIEVIPVEGNILAGDLNGNGAVATTLRTIISQQQMEELTISGQLILGVTFSTSDLPNDIKLYERNYLDVKAGIRLIHRTTIN